MTNLLDAIKLIAKENPEGFTVDLTTLKKVTNGISVAYLETQGSFGDEGLERVLKHAVEHEKKVGGWFNESDGFYYFDSVKIYFNRDEAIRAGRENKQIAIFDIGNLELVKL